MTFRHLASAAAALVATGAAFAQSAAAPGVSISGAMDVNVRYIDNTARDKQVGTDGVTASRLVFSGYEDLGGGLGAGFRLDGALAPDTGGPTPFTWQRRSTLSLFSKDLGEIRIGRDYTPTFWAWTLYDPFYAIGLGNSLNLANENNGIAAVRGAYTTLARSSNAVSWFAPATLGGVFAQVMVAPSENADGTRYVGGRLGYANGPLNVAIAGSQTLVERATGRKADVFNIAGGYFIGQLRLSGFYNQLKIDAYTRRNYMLAAHQTIGSWEVKGSYAWVKTSAPLAELPNLQGREAKQLALGVLYNLSKRTSPYIHYSRINNDSASAFRVASGVALTRGDNSQAIDIGIRHNF